MTYQKLRLRKAIALVGPSMSDRNIRRVYKRLRHEYAEIAIIALARSQDSAERISLLDAGADDCVGFPCNRGEILARVNAACRRVLSKPSAIVDAWPLRLDRVNRSLHRFEEPIVLLPQEFKILEIFALNDGVVLSRHEIADFAWSSEMPGVVTIDVHIGRLNRKIGNKDFHLIKNIRGVGFRFGESVSDLMRFFEGEEVIGKINISERVDAPCIVVENRSHRCTLKVSASLDLPDFVDVVVALQSGVDQRRRLRITQRDADQVTGVPVGIEAASLLAQSRTFRN